MNSDIKVKDKLTDFKANNLEEIKVNVSDFAIYNENIRNFSECILNPKVRHKFAQKFYNLNNPKHLVKIYCFYKLAYQEDEVFMPFSAGELTALRAKIDNDKLLKTDILIEKCRNNKDDLFKFFYWIYNEDIVPVIKRIKKIQDEQTVSYAEDIDTDSLINDLKE